MRDTYVLIVFVCLIGVSCFLAFEKVLDAEKTLIPIIAGFLGLLAKIDKPVQPSVPFLQRLGFSRPPPTLEPLSRPNPKENES